MLQSMVLYPCPPPSSNPSNPCLFSLADGCFVSVSALSLTRQGMSPLPSSVCCSSLDKLINLIPSRYCQLLPANLNFLHMESGGGGGGKVRWLKTNQRKLDCIHIMLSVGEWQKPARLPASASAQDLKVTSATGCPVLLLWSDRMIQILGSICYRVGGNSVDLGFDEGLWSAESLAALSEWGRCCRNSWRLGEEWAQSWQAAA